MNQWCLWTVLSERRHTSTNRKSILPGESGTGRLYRAWSHKKDGQRLHLCRALYSFFPGSPKLLWQRCTLYPWWTSHKSTDESESCRLLLGDGVTGWLGLVQVRQSLIQLHLGCLLLTLRGTVQEPKVNRQGPNLGQKNGFHPQKLRNLEGLTTSFWECLRFETTQTLEGLLLLKGTHWPTTIGTDLAILSSLAHHKEPVHLRSWRPLLRIRPSDHSPVCAAANLRLCICILPCSHIAWHSTNPFKSTICTEPIALHALWQDSESISTGPLSVDPATCPPAQLSCQPFLSLPWPVPKFRADGVQHPRPGLLKGELSWSGGFGKTPFHYFA